MLRWYFKIYFLLLLSQQLCAAESSYDAVDPDATGNGGTTSAPQRRGILDNINQGIRYAGQMFGINTAADVANLVAKAFSTATAQQSNQVKPDLLSLIQNRLFQREQPQTANRPNREQDYNYSQEQTETASQQNADTAFPPKAAPANGIDFNAAHLLTNMLRVIGFDASKLGALAINAIIMIAQAIGNAVMGTRQTNKYNADAASTGPEAFYERDQNAHQPRSAPVGTPIDWFLAKPTARMRKILYEIADRELPDKLNAIIEQIEENNGAKGQAGCLKMLICKSAPFIWGMQNSLAKRMNFPGNVTQYATAADDEQDDIDANRLSTKVFFKHLPNLEEYRQHGAQCETRFAQTCDLSRRYPPPK